MRRSLALLAALSVACATSSATRDAVTMEQRVHEAVQPWIGTPYRYGKSSLGGTDCSGFTRAVMAEGFGVTLPRTSREQARVGASVELGELSAGDLVFFDLRANGRGIDHVGLYAGGGLFVHARPRRGVGFDRLDDRVYRRGYRGARRVLDAQ